MSAGLVFGRQLPLPQRPGEVWETGYEVCEGRHFIVYEIMPSRFRNKPHLKLWIGQYAPVQVA